MAYSRHRKAILEAPPIGPLVDDSAEIHIITSRKEWLNALWGLYSFYHYSGERYRLCLHEDGSLGEAEFGAIRKLLPGARVIPDSQSSEEVLRWLAPFPRCQIIRKTKFISKKEFDFNFYLEAPIGILFDSDLIFYGRPDFVCDELIGKRQPGNWVNRDVHPGLSLTSDRIREKWGMKVPDHYNTGFGIWHRGSIRNQDLEGFLADLEVLDHPWRFEQTLHALCSGRTSANILPAEYDIYWGPLKPDPVMRHYVGAIRHLLFAEGVQRLKPVLTGVS